VCGHELNISVVDGLGAKHGTVTMDEVLGSDTDTLSCAIEVRELAPDITEDILSMFFQNRKRSGGDKIEEMLYSVEERRAVITFHSPEGLYFTSALFLNALYEFCGFVSECIVHDSYNVWNSLPTG